MSAQPIEPVWTIRHELSAGVLEGGPVTLTALQARALLARVDELQAMEKRAQSIRDAPVPVLGGSAPRWSTRRSAAREILGDES